VIEVFGILIILWKCHSWTESSLYYVSELKRQWCSRDRNLRDRDLAQISRRDRDRDFVIKAETETRKFETETRDLTFLWW